MNEMDYQLRKKLFRVLQRRFRPKKIWLQNDKVVVWVNWRGQNSFVLISLEEAIKMIDEQPPSS